MTASEIKEHSKLVDLIAQGLATDFAKLISEQTIYGYFGSIPMSHPIDEAVEQFDRLTKYGMKLDLIKGEYSK